MGSVAGGRNVKPRVQWEVAKHRREPGGGWQTLYAVKASTRAQAYMMRGYMQQRDRYARIRGERYTVRSYR